MKKLLKDLFYIPKYGKMSEKAFLSNITLSIIGIVLCLSTMALTAYAYFSWSLTTPTQTIQAGFYDCAVTIQAMEEDGVTVQSDVDQITLEGDEINLEPGHYQILIEKTQDSTASTGFCVITVSGTEYHTVQIDEKNPSLRFVLVLQETVKVSFVPHWGTSSKFASNSETDTSYIASGEEVTVEAQKNNLMLGTPQKPTGETTLPSESTGEPTDATDAADETEQRYVILEAGDTLYSIEQEYGIDRAKLKAYNNIMDVTSLPVGYKLLLPPDDYEIPETTAPSTEATEPSTEATAPSTEATAPSTEATEPTEPVTEPTEPPTEPSTEPTQPSTDATEPSTEATEPSAESTDYSTEATEPSAESTDSSTEATEPARDPAL